MNQGIDAAAAIPSLTSIHTMQYRDRRKKFPAIPQSRTEVDVRDNWAETTDGKQFLLVNDGTVDKILVSLT